jgi:Xaa-Pro aminopeptidase
MKPGVTIESLEDVAEPVYARYGYGEQFEARGRHVGHFVGISVPDVGDITGADHGGWSGGPAELDPLYALIKQRGVNSTPLPDRWER